MAKLGDVCTLINGYAFKPSDWSERGLPIIRIQNLNDENASFNYFAGSIDSKYIVKNGDLLFSWSGTPGTSFGAFFWNRGEGVLNQHIFNVYPDDSLYKPYFRYALNGNLERIISKAHGGVGLQHITKKELENIEISIPAMEVQRHIVRALDKVSGLIALRKQQLAKLDELVKSRFVEMFGDTASNPMSWPTMNFRQACVRLSDGPFGSNLKSEHYTQSGVRVIRLGNIGVGKFLDDDQSYISIDHYETIKKYTCRAGDIVIGTLGDPNLRACIIPKEIDIAINKADCVHYVPKSDILDKYFVCQYINCPETLLLASGMIHGQTRARVSSGQIAEMPIFIPPLALQKQFAAFVKQIDNSKLEIQTALTKLETLKKALMQQYFG